MTTFNRRAFLGLSVGALSVSVLQKPETASAQATCVSNGRAPFMPTNLTVDCASRRNFQNFRKNSDYMGLAGVVSMTYVQGKYGAFSAGNLFLFPWLKPKGQALGAAQDWQTVMPVSTTQVMTAAPIPAWTLPLDEYFCRFRLQTPIEMFIGFRVDEPFGLKDSWLPWYSDVSQLADGKPIGICWASDNLNAPWFGGSRSIPNTDTCNGKAWRNVITAGLKTASGPMC